MTQKSELIAVSQADQLEAAGAGTWNIANILPVDVDADSVFVDTRRFKRWSDYLIGLGEVSVETAPNEAFQTPEDLKPFLGRPPGAIHAKGIIRQVAGEEELPSSYRRPDGRILINEAVFLKDMSEQRKQDVPVESAFARHLDRAVRSSFLELLHSRYHTKNSMALPEKAAGPAPFLVAFTAETLGYNSFITTGVYAACYALALGADYNDARLSLGSAAAPLRLKRWSVFPCGLPLERQVEALARSVKLLMKTPKPTLIKHIPTA